MNTEIRIKKMIHKVFKNIILYTNYKNIKLNLLKQYITLQSIWYLIDSKINIKYLQSNIDFINISYDTNHLFKD